MPNCFQLLKDGSPVSLNKLDEDICKDVLHVEPHPKFYGGENQINWFDSIGFQIAMGKELGTEELRKEVIDYEMPQLVKILDYLEERYTSTSFYMAK